MSKRGISLIVLVITIIVMIILAASVVISLNNTGIIDKANTAVQLTDERQIQDLASLIWAEAYLDETRTDTIENVVKDKLEEQGVTEDKWNIQVSNTGVTVTSKSNGSAEDEHGYLSGTWIFNVTLIEPVKLWEYHEINFEFGGVQYNSLMWCEDLENGTKAITAHSTEYQEDIDLCHWYTGATSVHWDSPDRTITFTLKQQVSTEFYDWFTANATKVS